MCIFYLILFHFILTYSLNNWFTVGLGNPPYEQLGPGWKVDSDRQVSCLKGHAKPAFFARCCYFYHLGLHTTKNTKTAVAFADIFDGKNRKRVLSFREQQNRYIWWSSKCREEISVWLSSEIPYSGASNEGKEKLTPEQDCKGRVKCYYMHGGLSFSVIQKILKMAITPHNASWLSVACRGQLCLAKINTAQQLVCAQIPCILVNNDLPTRIYLATIRSYCFLQDSSKSLPKNYIWLKTAKKLQTMPKQRSRRGKLRPRHVVSGAIDCK